MEHKAYVFDYERFEAELGRTLYKALEGGPLDDLTAFIARHWSRLKDPFEGNPLEAAWQSTVEPQDAHQYGDLALTKFYEPSANIGLGPGWDQLQRDLEERESLSSSLILGRPFGPLGNLFDPGKMGSYFSSVKEVQKSCFKLMESEKKPNPCSLLPGAIKMFHAAMTAGKGLYVTF
jgi:hypothetical protein